ncbi:esterase/lipase family protein [Zhongshania sp.]|uniref:esterase/lipase family protein n=1 Tax=Zhongshania sp. TaxID=1971902 RepID=UPI0035651159
MAVSNKLRLFHRIIEVRALYEAAAFTVLKPLLHDSRHGDGHGVMVIPGFMANDVLTAQLRGSLNLMGYTAVGWGNGANFGMRKDVFEKTMKEVRRLNAETGGPITLIGWSLGGFYARALANSEPDLIRQVITLGSPFNVSLVATDAIESKNVRRLYKLLNPADHDELSHYSALVNKTPPVPFTSVFTCSDGIADWQMCVDKSESDRCQNIRIRASHAGMTHNALVLYLLHKLLPQQRDNWKPLRLGKVARNLLQMTSFTKRAIAPSMA